ncbi:MAG: hypothetical protein AB1499_13145 [Nitrospirota bacterium]
MNTLNDKLRKFDPAVDKRILVALSGLMWSGVGVMLCRLAVRWLSEPAAVGRIWYGFAGIFLALMIHHFGFLKLVNRNIERISAKKGKVCIFGFQPWKSYLIIAVMIAMGTTLRHSNLPRPYLAIIYVGFGGAMFLSSIRYFRIFFRLIKVK